MKGFGDLYKSKKINNKNKKPSKEKLINQAFQFHAKGNISEAIKYYQQVINEGCNDHRVFSNYGVILQDQNELNKAEMSYRKAIELNPDFANAYLNLGNLLRDLGKFQEAEMSYRKAIELNPEYAKAHFNLGFVLMDLGKSQEAFESYLKVIEINPSFSNIYPSIAELLNYSDISLLNNIKLRNILTIMLEKNDVSHKQLFKAFNFLYGNEIISNLEALDSDLFRNELVLNKKPIINALKKIIFINFELEKKLCKLRRKVCDLVTQNRETINNSTLEFIIALGEQCFLNEYVYSVSEEENISVNTIIKRCIEGDLSEKNISILSCYYPLYKLLDQIPLLKSFNSAHPSFKELIELQIIEPLKEIDLSKNIKSLGIIRNNISKEVKEQYEENPYPRWRYENYLKSNKIPILQVINNEIKPNYISETFGDEKLQILIAGCGTGKQILQAQRYKNADITAIDLSLSSLAYAKRKINELEIDNVELIQMDILEVSLLEKKFDIIECAGVLHHMEDPGKGLKALLTILKNNGFLQLSLYSETARKEIIKARKYIANKKLKPNKDDIRNFRQKIISGELRDLNSFKLFDDFYSLSEFRDLCFHTQEHRFTINKLTETFQSHQLEFLGFSISKTIKSLYGKYFPEDKKQTNLKNWEIFEEKHPNTFIEMYQFWVSKKEN